MQTYKITDKSNPNWKAFKSFSSLQDVETFKAQNKNFILEISEEQIIQENTEEKNQEKAINQLRAGREIAEALIIAVKKKNGKINPNFVEIVNLLNWGELKDAKTAIQNSIRPEISEAKTDLIKLIDSNIL